nr:uncharacterized protein LOC117274159 [Nicotiana tomentosiformis]
MVERKHKHLLETAKALLFQSKLPVKYWASPPLVVPSDFVPSFTHISPTSSSEPFTSSSSYDSNLPLRRPQRPHQTPGYLKDYVCTTVSKSEHFLLSDEACLLEPQFYQQYVGHPAWQEAMLKEFQALKANNTWDIVPLPPGKKASLVSGHVRLNIRLMGQLRGTWLNKSLYGLRQASRQWYAKLSSALQSKSFHASLIDYSLFTKLVDGSLTVVAVYVDDILVAGDNMSEITTLMQFLDVEIKIKDLRELHYFLGLEINRHPNGFLVSQHKFIMDLLSEFHCSDVSSVVAHLEPHVKLSAELSKLLPDPSL